MCGLVNYLPLKGVTGKEICAMEAVIDALLELDFGGSIALPWCLESFPRLHRAVKELEKLREEKDTIYE